MNLFELAIFIVSIVIGMNIARYAHGIAGYWLSVPAFIFGFLIVPGLFAAWQKYMSWAYPGGEHIPDCECGSHEYNFEQLDEEYRFVCRACERQYKRRRNKTYTYLDGQEVLYKELVKHQGWVKPQHPA